MNNTRTYHLAAELLASLEAEGYPLGTDKHLQVQEILRQLPSEADAAVLRLALCPLLARNPQEQTQVYEMFDECQKRVEAMMPTDTLNEPVVATAASEVAEKATQKRRWRLLIFSAPVLLAITIGAYYYFWGIPQPGETVQDIIENLPKSDTGSQNVLNQQLETNNQQPLFQPKLYPYDHDLSKYAITPPSVWQAWLFTHWWWLRWALLIPFTLLCIAIWLYLEQKRRKLIAEREHKDQPPYFWNIRIESGDEILTGDSFTYTLQVMRRRMGADTFALDLPRTIHATAERGGLPEFRFREHTQPVDYLLLIDRQSIQNHRARLFDSLYQAFREQEIEMARFFYDSDMRVCFNEEHSHGVGLQELQQRYSSARLLVIGTGAQLISPLSGKLAPWTSLFITWKQRALFTPKPLTDWGRLERRLPEIFTLLPATLQGLSFWLEALEDGEDARFEEWRTRVKDAPQLPIQPDENDPMPLLRLHYDTPMLQWIAACAIYPSLHWDLTLWLGRQVSVGSLQSEAGSPQPPVADQTITNLDNLLHLFRLPWFVEGEIPTPARTALLEWLEREHPALLQQLRAELALLLRQNPPPQASAASDDYQMNIALNEWLTAPDKQHKKELEQEIARLLAAGTEADFTVLKYLERPRTPLDFVVPDAWKKYVHPAGHAGLGWSPGLSWLFAVWLIGFVGLLWPVSENDLMVWAAVILALFMQQSHKLIGRSNDESISETAKTKVSPPNLRRWFFIFGLTILALMLTLVAVTTGSLRSEEVQAYDCNEEIVMYSAEKEVLMLCLDTKEEKIVYSEWLVRSAIESGNIRLADSLSSERAKISSAYKVENDIGRSQQQQSTMDSNNLSSDTLPSPYFKPALLSGEIDRDILRIYLEGDKNIGVALFNRGVAFYQTEQGDSACYYFRSALNFDSADVDFRRGLEWCNQTLSTSALEAPSDRKSGLEMVNVKGGVFTMGSTNGGKDECPHQTEVGDFRIGKYEVTRADWNEIMGTTLSSQSDCPNCPADNVSWDDVQLFLKKLNTRTGKQYRLPTEEEWEFAARGGRQSKGYRYAGSNNPDAVAWYGQKVNSANPVGSKLPNELGIYDMSGNVWEWCQNESLPYPNCQVDKCDGCRVLRGGSWYFSVTNTTVSNRDRYYPQRKSIDYGFRIAEGAALAANSGNASGLQPSMVSIQGGTFTMGSAEGNTDETPTRLVRVNNFYLGKYEVTFEEYDQFCEKTGRKKPKSARGKNPVVNVTWLDAVAYCNWLSQSNNLTPCYTLRGKNVTCNWSANGYRLPTEAEWEYAAKGGALGKNYTYAGSNNLEEVAWFAENANGKTHPVGQKKANEIDLYDMSGNAWEWCWDWKASYDDGPAIDPKGPNRGGVRVFRGGSWADNPFYCRTTVRYSGTPDHQSYSVGFRVVRNNR